MKFMAAKNRFEQVDERQDDAINLSLAHEGGAPTGTVICPALLLSSNEDRISPTLDLIQAFRATIRLANEIKAPIVVCDPEGLWPAEWGELFRAVD